MFRMDIEISISQLLGFKRFQSDDENITQVISENRFIKSKIKEVLRENFEDEDINIIAGMGAGKTDAVIEAAYDSGKRVILLVPLQIIARQKYFKYSKRFNIGLVHGRRTLTNNESDYITSKKINEIIDDDDIKIILCVYNSLPKLFDSEGFDPEKFILVIDEIHNFVTQINFRFNEISYIKEQQSKFLQRITLTGTPEGTLFNPNKTFIFKPRNQYNKQEVKLIAYHNNGLYKLYNLLLQSSKDDRKIILIDDLAKLRKLRFLLIYAGIDSSEVKIFSSETKQSDEFYYVEKQQRINSKIKYLLTTRVLAEGASIFGSSKVSIYILDSTDLIMKRQFIRRFREGISEVYDMLPFNSKESEPLFNIYEKFNRLKTLFQKRLENNALLMAESRLLKLQALNSSFRKPYVEDYPFIYKSALDDKLKISEEAIANNLLLTLNRKITKNIRVNRQYYEDVAGFNVSILNYRQVTPKNIINIQDYRRVINSSRELRDIGNLGFIYGNISEIFTLYLEKEKMSELKTLIDNDLIIEEISDERRAGIGMLFKNPKFYNYFNQLLNLALDGFDKKFLLNALDMLVYGRNKKLDYLLEQINYHLLWQTLEKYPDLISSIKRVPGYKIYRDVDKLLKYINVNEIIVLNEFKEKFNETINQNFRKFEHSHNTFLKAVKVISPRKQKRNSVDTISEKRIKHYFVKVYEDQTFLNILNEAEVFQLYYAAESQVLLERLISKRVESILEKSSNILEQEDPKFLHIINNINESVLI